MNIPQFVQSLKEGLGIVAILNYENSYFPTYLHAFFQGFDEHVSQDTRLSTEDVCVCDMIDISVRGRLNLDYDYTKSDLKLISGDSSDNESDAGSRSRSTFIPGPGPSYRCREYGDWHLVWWGCTTNLSAK